MKTLLYIVGVLISMMLLYADYEGHSVGTLLGFSDVDSGKRGAGGVYYFNHK